MMVSISPDLDMIHLKKSIIAKSFPIKSQRSITNLKMENVTDFFDDSYNSENCYDLFTKHQIKYINFSSKKSVLKLQIEEGNKSSSSKYPLGIENTIDDLKNYLCQQYDVDKRLIHAFINNENRDEIPSDVDLKTLKEDVIAFIFPIDAVFVDSFNHSYPYVFKFPMKLQEVIPEIKPMFGIQAEDISFSINDKVIDQNASIYSILKNKHNSPVTIVVSEKAELNKIDIRCLIENQYVTIKFPFYADYSFRDLLSIVQIYFDTEDDTMELSIEDNEECVSLNRPVRSCNLEKTKYLTLRCDSKLKLRRFYRINSNGPLEQIIIHPTDTVNDIISQIANNPKCPPGQITLMFICKGKECVLDKDKLFTYYFIPFKQELIAKIGENNSSQNHKSKSTISDSEISSSRSKIANNSSTKTSRKSSPDNEDESVSPQRNSPKQSNQKYKLKLKIHQNERLAESEATINYSPLMKIESIYDQDISGLPTDSFLLYHSQKLDKARTFQSYGINGDDSIDVYSSEFFIFENHININSSQRPKMIPLVLPDKISYPKIRSQLNLGNVDFFLECNEDIVSDGCFSDNFSSGSVFIIEKVRVLILSIEYLGKSYKFRFDCRKRANEVISALADKIHKDPETIQLFNVAFNSRILPEERLYKHFRANSNKNDEFEIEAREMKNMSFVVNQQTEEFFFLTTETIGELKVYLKDNFESIQNLTGLYIVYNGQLHYNKEIISEIFSGATSSDEPFLIFSKKPDEITIQFIFNMNQLTVEKAFVNCDVRMIKGVKIQNVRKVAAQMIQADDPEQIVLRSTKDGKEYNNDDDVLNENIEIAASFKNDDENQSSPKKFSEIQSKIQSMNQKRKTPQSEKKKPQSSKNDDSSLLTIKTTKRSASVLSKSKSAKNNTSKDSSFSTPRRPKPKSKLSKLDDSDNDNDNEENESSISQNTSKSSSSKKKKTSSSKLKIKSPYRKIPATQPIKEKNEAGATTAKKEISGTSSSASKMTTAKGSTPKNESPRSAKTAAKGSTSKAMTTKNKTKDNEHKSEAKSSLKSANQTKSLSSSKISASTTSNKTASKSVSRSASTTSSRKSSPKSSPKSSRKSSPKSSPKSSRKSSAKSSTISSPKSSRKSSAKSSAISSPKSSRKSSAKSSAISSPRSSPKASRKSSPNSSLKLKKANSTTNSNIAIQKSKKRSTSQAGRQSNLSNRSNSKVTISQIPQKSKRSQSFSGKNANPKKDNSNAHSMINQKETGQLKSSFKIDSSFNDKSTSFTEINLSNDQMLYSESMIQNASDASCISDLGKGNGIYWPIRPGANDYIFKFRGFDNGRSFKLLLPKDATVQHVQQRVAEERTKQGTPTEPENVNVHLGMMILQEDIVLRSISIPDDIDYFSISYKYGESSSKRQSFSNISNANISNSNISNANISQENVSSSPKDVKAKKKKKLLKKK